MDEYPINERLTAKVGYRDAHVGIEFQTGIPLVGRIPLRIEKDEIAHVEKLLVVERDWIERAPSFGGRPMPKLIEARISKNVTSTVGHGDCRVEIIVATGLPWPCPKTVTIKVEQEAVSHVEYAMMKAAQWRDKSEVVRYLEGAE